MAKKIAKPTLEQPDPSEMDAEEKRRTKAEYTSKGTIDGRRRKRANAIRHEQINLKTSLEAKKKLDRLSVFLDDAPFNAVFERALDALAEKLGIEGW